MMVILRLVVAALTFVIICLRFFEVVARARRRSLLGGGGMPAHFVEGFAVCLTPFNQRFNPLHPHHDHAYLLSEIGNIISLKETDVNRDGRVSRDSLKCMKKRRSNLLHITT